jgi:hypothetical protein
MPTFNQLIRHGREEKRRTDRTEVLVFGLLVTRIIRFVHSVLFSIPVFCSIKVLLDSFCSLPIINKLSKKWQLIWFYVISVILCKSLFAVGYLWMDDLSRAISQFYPVVSGGLGGGNTPMPPTNPSEGGLLEGYYAHENEHSHDQQRGSPFWSKEYKESGSKRLFLNLEVEDQNTDTIGEQVKAESDKCEKIKAKIIAKTHELLVSEGYHIPDEGDIERAINVVMTEHEMIDIDRRKKRFYYLYSRLGKNGDKFWVELLELLSDYDINKSDSDD